MDWNSFAGVLRNTGPFNPWSARMRFLLSIIAVLALSQISDVFASDCVVDTSTPTFINGKRVDSRCDENGRVKTSATLSDTLAGEDGTSDVLKVEERYLTIPTGGTDAMISANQLYKSNTGHVKGISCSSDATATAGTIALRDSTVAGAGNILWSQDILAIAYTPGMIREDLDTDFSVGLFLDFTTTADVKCMVRYR